MKVLKYIEDSDGSATIHYELSEFDIKVIKRSLGLGVKKLTKKRLNDFLMRALIEGTRIKEVKKWKAD